MTAITTGPQTLTAAGTVTGVLSTAALTTIPTIRVDVTQMTPGKARIEVQDTASSTAFSDAQTVAVFDITGGEAQTQGGQFYQDELSTTPDEMPDIRIGATNCALRVIVTELTASTITLNGYTAP
jgi:hypothetical protein